MKTTMSREKLAIDNKPKLGINVWSCPLHKTATSKCANSKHNF